MNKEQEETALLRVVINIQDKLDAIMLRLDKIESSKEQSDKEQSDKDELLTIKALTNELGCGYKKAKDLITRSDNPIPTIRIGKRDMVSRGVLQEWIKNNSDAPDIKSIASTYCQLNPR